jgi:hypothetical protein
VCLNVESIMTPAYLIAPRLPQSDGAAHTLVWDAQSNGFHWAPAEPMITKPGK